MHRVDLNCDMGESFGAYHLGNDAEILRFVTSANIACGFHAGDPHVMRRTVRLALDRNVSVGAHPSLPDLTGFGRREMNVTPQEVYDIVVYQTGALAAFVKSEGGVMSHVKPHGALYNMAAKSLELAEAIAEAIRKTDAQLILFGLAGSELVKAGERAGLRGAHEVFADRTYQSDGSLTSRSNDNALITSDEQAIAQVMRLVKEGLVRSQQGIDLRLKADTVCIHGDGAHALSFARRIREHLESSGVEIRALDR